MVKKYITPQATLVDLRSEDLMATSPIFPGSDDEEPGTKRQEFGGSIIWGNNPDSDL